MVKIKLTSSFKQDEYIPPKYSYKNDNISPPLKWRVVGSKKNIKSYAILCVDPDAPKGKFFHWVIWNIPKWVKGIREGVPKKKKLKYFNQGVNDFGKIGWDGPSPPSGTHRYIFFIFALKTYVDSDKLNGDDVLRLAKKNMVGWGSLIGLYRSKKA